MADPKKTPIDPKARLREIADAIGVPVSYLYDASPKSLNGEAFELLRLYAAITDPAGREYLMHVARMEVARCQAPDTPQPSRT